MDITNLGTLESANRFTPPVVNLLLTILIAIALARLVWLVIPAPSTARTQPPSSKHTPGQTSQFNGPDITVIQKSHLFGVATEKSGSNDSDVPVNAPETHLDLTLDGILTWNHPDLSRVLIRGPKGKEHHYAIGDDVPGNATISAVHPDRVILKRNGSYETLRMKFSKVKLEQSHQGNTANLGAAVRDRDYGAVRTRLLKHPSKITQIMRLQPAHKNHEMAGYRVYPGSKRQLFQHLGLQSGDLITSINGIKLNSQKNAMSLLGELRTARRLNVTLKRHGATHHITLSLQ